MAKWTRFLDDDDLRAIEQAVVDSGLATPPMLSALMAPIPHRYTGLLPGWELPPNMRLRVQLGAMNRVHNLQTGEVPLALFLSSVIETISDASKIAVFEAALTKVKGYDPPTVAVVRAGGAPAGQAAGPPGATDLANANMTISREALITGLEEMQTVRYLRRGSLAAASVFKIVIHRHMNGVGEFITDDRPKLSNGTGWVIAPRLGITNHHVINARSELCGEVDATAQDLQLQAETATVRFDYYEPEDTRAGMPLGAGALVAADKELDFALLRLPEETKDRPALRLRRQLIAKRIDQPLGICVNILQHPAGNPMRLGFRNNFVVLGDGDTLAYLTETATGSSGSPVCDDAWSVAALHYGSRAVSDQKIELMGRLVRRENVGTPLPRILRYLEQSAPALHREIQDGQQALAP
jgi:hypothetical protein